MQRFCALLLSNFTTLAQRQSVHHFLQNFKSSAEDEIPHRDGGRNASILRTNINTLQAENLFEEG